jgi:hypothetical protein
MYRGTTTESFGGFRKDQARPKMSRQMAMNAFVRIIPVYITDFSRKNSKIGDDFFTFAIECNSIDESETT